MNLSLLNNRKHKPINHQTILTNFSLDVEAVLEMLNGLHVIYSNWKSGRAK